MRVEDIFVVRGNPVLGGPLLVPAPPTRAEVAALFGSSITLVLPDGRRLEGTVLEISASQTMSLETQVLLGIEAPLGLGNVPVGSLVFSA